MEAGTLTDPLRITRPSARLRSLATMAGALRAAQRVEDLVTMAAEEVHVSSGAASVSVSRWDREHQTLHTLINIGELGPTEEREPADETYSLAAFPGIATTLEQGLHCHMAVDDPDTDPYAVALLRELDKATALSVPIRADDVTWGELFVTTGQGEPPFEPDDGDFLQAVADQLGLAIARAELLERLTHLAFCDPLTGLANRRGLEEQLERSLTVAHDHDLCVSLVLMDMDDLKAMNDGQGHDAGDTALRRIARTLTELTNGHPGALVCRIGGDEFCLLLEDTDAARAEDVARQALEALCGAGIGVSAGLVTTRPDLQAASDLLRAADAALYAAKRAGRGRACVAGHEPLVAWRRAAPRAPDRRGLRPHGADLGAMIATGLKLLDGPLAACSALDRLQALATTLVAELDAAATGVSLCRRGDDHVQTMFSLDQRSGLSTGVLMGVVGDRFALAEYPLTARLVAREGSAVVLLEDEAADSAERDFLREYNLRGVLAVAVADVTGAWLVELFDDASGRELSHGEHAVRLLVGEAVRGGAAKATTGMQSD